MSNGFSLYDPNQFQGVPYQNITPYQAPNAINPADPFGVNAAFNPQGGGYDPSQFSFLGGGGNSPTGFGGKFNQFWGDYGQSIGSTLSAVGGLFNLYGGIKSLGLMSKQFKLAKKATRLGIDNQATAYNNTIEQQQAAERASAAAGTGTASTADFERMQKWGG